MTDPQGAAEDNVMTGHHAAEPPVLTLEEAARLLRVHPMTAYSLARRGRIPAVKVGGVWRLTRTDLLDWLSQQAKRRMTIAEAMVRG